ncbi:MAG TPA: LysR family transcriptional regulator [Polyangia bacterium]|jgi:DNA-binding transcriptional LysR family regulator
MPRGRATSSTVDLNGLRVFMKVAEETSFSRAGKALGIANARVTRTIRALEASMGVQLLHRTTRRVSLTSAGSDLIQRMAPALASLDDAVGGLPESQERLSGELRVCAPIDVGTLLLPRMVLRLAQKHAELRVSVRLLTSETDPAAEGFDVAIRLVIDTLDDSSMVVRKVAALGGGLFASPGYLAERGVPQSVDDLEGHDWVVLGGMRRLTLDGPDGAPVIVRPHGQISGDNMLFVRESLRANGGIGYLPEFLAAPCVGTGELVHVLPRHTTRGPYLSLVWPSTRHLSPKIAAFRDLLLEMFQNDAVMADA